MHTFYQFVDKQSLRAVILNEGIVLIKIVVYMAFIVEGEDKLVVPFMVVTFYLLCFKILLTRPK